MDVSDRALQRLLGGETHRLNQALVQDAAYLSTLLAMDAPILRTQSGGTHRFDRDALDRFAADLSPLVRATVRLPLRFFVPHDMQGLCHLPDEVQIEAVQQHGFAANRRPDGRLWVAFPLAVDLARRFPTLVEFARQ